MMGSFLYHLLSGDTNEGEIMSVAKLAENWNLDDEEPFQPPLEGERADFTAEEYAQAAEDMAEEISEGGIFGSLGLNVDEPGTGQTQEEIEAAGDDGEDFGGEIDLDEPDDEGGEIELDEATLLHKARQLAEIQELSEEVAKAQQAYESAKKTATARKADFEESVERLTRSIRASKESLPLFDRPSPVTSKPAPTVEIPAANGWEGVQLSGIEGFPAKVRQSLEDLGVFTLGSLATWTAANDKLTSLKGVGPAKAEAAEEALTKFWASWDAKYPPKPAEAT